jgi:hypothetical protein
LQINSQSDLAWIELTLMKGLGVAPEDSQKVYFFGESEIRPKLNSSESIVQGP